MVQLLLPEIWEKPLVQRAAEQEELQRRFAVWAAEREQQRSAAKLPVLPQILAVPQARFAAVRLAPAGSAPV